MKMIQNRALKLSNEFLALSHTLNLYHKASPFHDGYICKNTYWMPKLRIFVNPII